ncbi:putative methyltransferase-like protein 24 [Synchiropus picturatus]
MRGLVVRCFGSGGLQLRAGLLLVMVPPLLLGLQLLVVGTRLPGDPGEAEQGQQVAFSVISIEPDRGRRGRRTAAVRFPVRTETSEDPGEYAEENELHMRQVGPRPLEMQPWATDPPTFSSELSRLIRYISSPQVNCSKVLPPAASRWLLCAEEWLLSSAPCVAYSFSMSGGDADFLKTVSGLGCEVHTFDPSNSNVSRGYHGNRLAGLHGEGGVVRQHKTWLEWRARRKGKAGSKLGSVSGTLADIMTALGHHIVHFLYADLLSAEWRVFQNWIETGTLQRVHHLIAATHLQWPGFEVGGSEQEVLRYWFSVLQGLQSAGLKLVHTSAGPGQNVLRHAAAGAHSSYTLSWVNMRR